MFVTVEDVGRGRMIQKGREHFHDHDLQRLHSVFWQLPAEIPIQDTDGWAKYILTIIVQTECWMI
jgi:hypothetical protein